MDSVIFDVTVGIPFYCETKNEDLVNAVDSIINQTLLPCEIHLIQDGPVSFKVQKTVNNYLCKSILIKHIIIPTRKGLSHALNTSILQSKAHYYARMDSDDISHPERLKRQLDYLEINPDIDFVGTWAMEFASDINSSLNRIRSVPTDQRDIYRMFHYRNPFNHPSIIFRKSVFAKIGLYDTRYLKAQDTELYARSFKLNTGVANIPEVLYYLRTNDTADRRANFTQIKYQVSGRYKYNTWSPVLNILKVMSIFFRLMPKGLQRWFYRKFTIAQ